MSPVLARMAFLAKAAIGFTLLLVAMTVMAGTQVLTLFHGRRFCAEVVGATLCRAVLWLFGIRVELPDPKTLPAGQVVYTANHTSSLDLFALVAMGLPNTRYFMKRGAWVIPPFAFAAWLMGTFFTVPQTRPEKRTRIFQRADRVLRRTGESVFLSPEGTRVTTGEIGPFNKGAFHLATSLGAPIQPLFIEIPPAINPGKSYVARAGTVRIHALPLVTTAGWRLDELLQNKERVRAAYVEFHQRIHGGQRAA